MKEENQKIRDTRSCKSFESHMHSRQMIRNVGAMVLIFIICILDALFEIVGTADTYTLFIPGLFGVLTMLFVGIPQLLDIKAIKKENLKYKDYSNDLTSFLKANKGFTRFIWILSTVLVAISLIFLCIN